MKEDITMEYITLSNGVKMPQFGYGVFEIQHRLKEIIEREINSASQCKSLKWNTVKPLS